MAPSASGLDRAAVCPASEVLPHTIQSANPDAERGVVIHAFLEAVPNVGEKEAISYAPARYRDELAMLDLSVLPLDATKYTAEVAFAFDVVTGKGRVLGQGLKRQYASAAEPPGPNELVGTADVVGLTPDAVVIPDFKTGHADLQPREMRQLLFLSLAACRAYGRTRAISGVIYVREDGSSYFSKAEFDEFDLDAFEIELREIVARVAEAKAQRDRGEQLVTVEGEHCRYCPAFDYCPSKMSLVRAFAAAPDALELKVEGATEEQLAQAWERVVSLKRVVERVEGVIKTRARETPISLGGGQVLGAVSEEEIRPEVASMVLEAMHGADLAEASVKTTSTITKASVENALRRFILRPGEKITHLKNAAFQAIRDADGMGVSYSIRKHRPKSAAATTEAPPLIEGQAGESKTIIREMLAQGEAEYAAATGKPSQGEA